jgi:hypothetical protein
MCLSCGDPLSDPDHVKTRGAGGGDAEGNVRPLCRGPGTNDCHSRRHTGELTFDEAIDYQARLR